MRVVKDFLWMFVWIALSAGVALWGFTVCADRFSRLIMSVILSLLLVGVYLLIMLLISKGQLKSGFKKNVIFVQTMVYMVVNIIALTFMPNIVGVMLVAVISIPLTLITNW